MGQNRTTASTQGNQSKRPRHLERKQDEQELWNFLTLDSAIKKFGADATRIALADGGDGIEDANFEETVANSIVLKLFELRKWIEDVVTGVRILKDDESFASVREAGRARSGDTIQRRGEKLFWDKLFENELDTLVRETVHQFEASVWTSYV
jgi:leucyl-tRNA synthetase